MGEKTIDIKEVIREKLNYFLNNNIKVHITKFNKSWLDGYIFSCVNDDLYLMKDSNNKETIRLFVSEVYDIAEYKEREE